MIGIYKITSPTGKVYIGQSWNIEKRKKQYNTLSCKKQYKLYESLKKYGFINHIFEVIEICENPTQEILNNKELYYYNLYPKDLLLNIIIPGKGVGRHHKDTINKISKSKCKIITQFNKHGEIINYWNSLKDAAKALNISSGSISANINGKTKYCLKEYCFRYGKYDTNINIPFTKRLYKKNRKYSLRSPSYPIFQYTDTFVFIKEWKNAKEAAKELNLNHKSISQSAKGNIYTSGGFRWRNKYNKDNFTIYKHKRGDSNPTNQ